MSDKSAQTQMHSPIQASSSQQFAQAFGKLAKSMWSSENNTPKNRPQDISYMLFDFDGVLANTEPLYFERDRETISHFGYIPTQEELESLVGTASNLRAVEILADHGITVTSEAFDRVRNVSETIYNNPSVLPSEGLLDLWHLCRAHGIQIAVVSSSHAADLMISLRRFGLADAFDVLISFDEVTQPKPHPEPYLRALAELSGALSKETLAAPDAPEQLLKLSKAITSQAVVFEDSATGMRAGHDAGCYTIAFQGYMDTQVTSYADACCGSFSELAAELTTELQSLL